MISLSYILIFFFHLTYGGNVLFVSMPGSISHRRSLFPLAESLANRGHSVTVFSEVPELDNARGKNVTNKVIEVIYPMETYAKLMSDEIWEKSYFDPLNMLLWWEMCSGMTTAMLEQHRHEFDEILNQHWDLIFVDIVFTPAGMMFVSLTKAPYMTYGTTVFSTPESLARSIPSTTSIFPAMFLHENSYDHQKFWDRMLTTWSEMKYVFATYLVDLFVISPRFKSIVPDISISNFYYNADGVILDYPVELDYPRPSTSDMIHVAGKCKPSHSLHNKDLLEFIEDPSSKGTIVIAFGHSVKWVGSPPEVKRNFAIAINALNDYRVFWQFEGDPPIKMGAHVKIMHWLPQLEILNHPKTKVFISHGGLKSIMEAVCAHVPMVLVPFFAEQIRNGILMHRSNAGEVLDKHNLTVDNILNTVKKVAANESYMLSISKLKWSIVEKPISSADNGIFWSEFMMRHKGLPKSWFQLKGQHMNWFTYFCVDIIVVVGLFLFFSLLLLIRSLTLIKSLIR